MNTQKHKIRIAGTVTPPRDLHLAARQSLGSRYDEFIREFPDFTPQQLVKFTER